MYSILDFGIQGAGSLADEIFQAGAASSKAGKRCGEGALDLSSLFDRGRIHSLRIEITNYRERILKNRKGSFLPLRGCRKPRNRSCRSYGREALPLATLGVEQKTLPACACNILHTSMLNIFYVAVSGCRDYSSILGVSSALRFWQAAGPYRIRAYMTDLLKEAVELLVARWGTGMAHLEFSICCVLNPKS